MRSHERRPHRDTDAWRAGIEDALAVVRSKRILLDMRPAAYLAALDEVENTLLAELANGGPLTSVLDTSSD